MFKGLRSKLPRAFIASATATLTAVGSRTSGILDEPDYALSQHHIQLHQISLAFDHVFPTSVVGNRLVAHCDSYSSFTYPANDPIEDRHVIAQAESKSEEWQIAAVFDGHGGWQVSELASKELISAMKFSLDGVPETDALSIDAMAVAAFEKTERDILKRVSSAFQTGFGEVAKVGSCVLLSMRKGDRLVVANCGDCRAVLASSAASDTDAGSIGKSGDASMKLYSTRITRDHNCRVPLEQLKLQLEHAGEPNLYVCKNPRACYVKGRLQLTRSLGDVYLKYPEFNGQKGGHRSSGRYIPDPYTPPYVSHLPDVHHLRLTEKDRFVILGSDGLWDYLSDQEAVDIVSSYLSTAAAMGSESAVLSSDEAAQRLVDRALAIAAEGSGMTAAELRELRPGKPRRSRHDDTTAVVVFFDK